MTIPMSVTPPRWAQHFLRAWLPSDSMRDAIVGDLHEELVRDVASVGAPAARTRYRLRVAGIVAYAIVDTLRMRAWGSTPSDVRRAPVRVSTPAAAAAPRVRVRRFDFWILVSAFGVLGVGIVGNTLLFSAARHSASATTAMSPAVGAASITLALGSAACAAVLLCVGPRWLRRRLCHKTIEAQRSLT